MEKLYKQESKGDYHHIELDDLNVFKIEKNMFLIYVVLIVTENGFIPNRNQLTEIITNFEYLK